MKKREKVEIVIDELIRKYQYEGMKIHQLADYYHCSHKKISAMLKEHNVEVTPGAKEVKMVGKKFGYLTVLGREGTKHYKGGKTDSLWLCKCDCGNEVVVTGYCLFRGTSCGCRKRKTISESLKTHGGTGTKLYGVWLTMRNRCYNKNTKSYFRYGGRGISVCDEWRNDFSSFKKWAEEKGYKDGLTIERINNNGNYEPSNCRWATLLEQSHNKRNNHYVIYNGIRYTITELGRLTGIDRRVIDRRLKRGMSVDDAVHMGKG